MYYSVALSCVYTLRTDVCAMYVSINPCTNSLIYVSLSESEGHFNIVLDLNHLKLKMQIVIKLKKLF
jgi:hypothetical protein